MYVQFACTTLTAKFCTLCRIFAMAAGYNLDLHFCVDETSNPAAKGLAHIARKTLQHGFKGRVVCAHCW